MIISYHGGAWPLARLQSLTELLERAVERERERVSYHVISYHFIAYHTIPYLITSYFIFMYNDIIFMFSVVCLHLYGKFVI